ncbi:hypothetical protein BGZ99_008231 [Dissophora globulifera]|uniref:Uncharacterized protein n=1 Tax=Dissophora globulifera TaxID=979702 RepID=A0A9P6R7H3_9FUNG|nr:hypothetical protein BGZ99_008231 [Dissophora globulifera]
MFLPNHTYFTSPVGFDMVYTEGANETFSWQMACVAPGDSTSATPTTVEVQLIDSTDTNKAFYLEKITTIDCTKSQGNTAWTIPKPKGGADTLYSLKIIIDPTPAYSGKFKILPKDAPAPAPAPSTPAGNTNKQSGAGALAPVLSGAALVASAAVLLF